MLVECQQTATYNTGEPCCILKFDSANRITLHKVEEKMYTLNQLEIAFNAGRRSLKAKGLPSHPLWRSFNHFMKMIDYDGEERDNGFK